MNHSVLLREAAVTTLAAPPHAQFHAPQPNHQGRAQRDLCLRVYPIKQTNKNSSPLTQIGHVLLDQLRQ